MSVIYTKVGSDDHYGWLVSQILEVNGYISTENNALFKNLDQAIEYVKDKGHFEEFHQDPDDPNLVWTESVVDGNCALWVEIRRFDFLDGSVSQN